jgi:hypothetical protein
LSAIVHLSLRYSWLLYPISPEPAGLRLDAGIRTELLKYCEEMVVLGARSQAALAATITLSGKVGAGSGNLDLPNCRSVLTKEIRRCQDEQCFTPRVADRHAETAVRRQIGSRLGYPSGTAVE